jgi:hypothetical protein
MLLFACACEGYILLSNYPILGNIAQVDVSSKQGALPGGLQCCGGEILVISLVERDTVGNDVWADKGCKW